MVATAKENVNNVTIPSRREFLNCALGASVLLAGAGTCAGLAWFTQRQISFKDGSGYFQVDLSKLPSANGVPIPVENSHAYLVNLDGGLVAYYLCTLHGCRVRWSSYNNRFECPCCGSKFELNGDYIEGPAPRSLDRNEVRVTTRSGTVVTSDDGAPLAFEDATSIVLNLNRFIYGTPRELSPSWLAREARRANSQ